MPVEFTRLHQDLELVGPLEEVLVEQIAQEYWRLVVAAEHEVEALAKHEPLEFVLAVNRGECFGKQTVPHAILGAYRLAKGCLRPIRFLRVPSVDLNLSRVDPFEEVSMSALIRRC